MRSLVMVGAWLYIVASVMAEVVAFYLLASVYVVATVVMTLAASQGVAIVLFYMGLKNEPGPLKILMLIAILFLSGLLVATIASLG